MIVEILSRLFLVSFFIATIAPLKFNQHIIALVRAEVVKIDYVSLATLNTNKFMAKETKEKGTILTQMQIISLKIVDILSVKIFSNELADWARKDKIVEVRNPWIDQKPDFKCGDHIQAWIQYVSSSEDAQKPEKDAQWWFYDPGEKDRNRPPRQPFKNIQIISAGLEGE